MTIPPIIWTVGGGTWREPTQPQAEHVNSIQKSPDPGIDTPNPPKVTMQTPAPLLRLILNKLVILKVVFWQSFFLKKFKKSKMSHYSDY